MAKHVICDTKKRLVFILGQIKPITATLVENALRELTKLHRLKPVNIFIRNEKGGDAYASLRIFQMIKNAHLKINTIADGAVFSGSFLILQAGQERFLIEGATPIFHMAEDFLFRHESFNAKRYMESAWSLLLIDAHQFLIFTERGRPVSEIAKLFRRNAKISAQQALELHLIDSILPKNKIPKI